MNLRQTQPAQRPIEAFTMVEIAICIAIIGFALVAIIGVLPLGMQVQRDNREDTIINQDGTFFLEAIRSGSRGLDHLVRYVTNVNGIVPATGSNIIGELSRPYRRNEAQVLALSGALGDKGASQSAKDFAFSYLLRTEITNALAADATLSSNLFEVRLRFFWPLLPNGGVGSGRKTLRTLVSGNLTNEGGLFFFNAARFLQ